MLVYAQLSMHPLIALKLVRKDANEGKRQSTNCFSRPTTASVSPSLALNIRVRVTKKKSVSVSHQLI